MSTSEIESLRGSRGNFPPYPLGPKYGTFITVSSSFLFRCEVLLYAIPFSPKQQSLLLIRQIDIRFRSRNKPNSENEYQKAHTLSRVFFWKMWELRQCTITPQNLLPPAKAHITAPHPLSRPHPPSIDISYSKPISKLKWIQIEPEGWKKNCLHRTCWKYAPSHIDETLSTAALTQKPFRMQISTHVVIRLRLCVSVSFSPPVVRLST